MTIRDNGYRFRAYAGSTDLDRILALAAKSWSRIGADSQVHPGNVCWRLGKRILSAGDDTIGLWCSDEGELVAFMFQHDGSPADLHIDTDWRRSEPLSHAALDWSDEYLRCRNGPGDPPELASIGCLSLDDVRQRLLSSRGFRRNGRSYQRMIRETAALSAEPPLPDGYAIRATDGRRELAAWLQAHHQAFQSSELTEAELNQVRMTPQYRPELDRVVVDRDQRVVAFAIGWFDESSATMEFEPVGCVPDQQRRGLAKALMHDLIARAAGLGARQVSLTARHDHPGVTAFYRDCGFRLHTMEYEFLRSGTQTGGTSAGRVGGGAR